MYEQVQQEVLDQIFRLRTLKINIVIFIIILRVMHQKLIIFLLMLSIVTSNLWDNIFSHMKAKAPIILKSSLSFQFPFNYEDFELTGTFDFNKQLDILSVIAEKDLGIMKLKLFMAQLDLKTYIVDVQSMLKGCERYSFEGVQQKNIKPFDLQKYESKIYLINILFKWVGRISQKRQLYDEFQLNPNLLMEYKQLEQQIPMKPLLYVDRDGNVVRIYENSNKKKQLPFQNRSEIKKKLECKAEVKVITQEDVKGVVEGLLEARGIDLEQIQKIDIPDILK